MTTPEILFYLNLGLIIVVLIDTAGVFVLLKKTACMRAAGIVAISLEGLAIAVYTAQLITVSLSYAYSDYFVYAATGAMGAATVAVAVYCITLYKRARRGICIATGVLQFFQPIGAIAMMVFAIKKKPDTRVQELVFAGYKYTFAAFGAYLERYKTDFVDAGGIEEFEPLDNKAVKLKLKEAKKNATSPEGRFAYGVFLSHYMPQKMRKAFKCFKKAAKFNHPPALFNLGYCYETGVYVNRDLKRAAEYYKRAATLNDDDAELRLAIVDIKTGKYENGLEILTRRSAERDLCAEFDHALCMERGLGVEKNLNAALGTFFKCADLGLACAQQHILELAIRSFASPELDGLFSVIVKHPFVGAFDNIIKGVAEVREKRASDAAKMFLSAVKLRGRWEGFARLLVGTLYIDSGEFDDDRRNGAAYVRSAIGMTPIAKDIYATVRKELK